MADEACTAHDGSTDSPAGDGRLTRLTLHTRVAEDYVVTTDDRSDALPAYVRGLCDPLAYPHGPESIELRQTHISYVFMAGDRVYKTKKPVNFGFIDQQAPEQRERFCHQEVRLNRRLTRDVYSDVVPVVRREDGSFAIDADAPRDGDQVVEWAVKMRRLPDEATLDRLVAAGSAPGNIVERLVRRLIAFHEAAALVKNDPTFAGGEAVRAWWRRESSEAEPFIGGTWSERDAASMHAFVERSLDAYAPLFDERLASGRVVEGHGDLQAKHVYVLGDGVDDLQIVDCIEFTEWFHFRYLDAGYDIGFLAMDLEAMSSDEPGAAGLGDELAGRYIAAAGDETMGVLQPLHRTFRAFVRGKVESIGAAAAEVPAAQQAVLAASAERYFALAARYAARRRAPALVLLCGLSGTGKSTVAGTLAGRIGAAYVSSDAVRKQQAGIDPRSYLEENYRSGLYAPKVTERTYEAMRERAAQQLAAGRCVVLDATHGSAADRAAALAVARSSGVPSLIAELRLDDETARTRIEARLADPLHISDATWEVYERQREAFEPITRSEGSHLQLDATLSPGELARMIAEELPPAG